MSYARKFRKIKKKKAERLLKVFLALIIIATFAFSSIGIGFLIGLNKDLPRLEEQAQGASAQTSKIYDSNGALIATFHAEQNRVIVPLSEIPEDMKNAIIAIEDERFYQHSGLDPRRIIGALLADIKAGGKPVEGASTITQQYVRNIFLTTEKTFERKIKEMALAYQVEQKYSKDKILEKYLNTIYFSSGCYGVETTSETFFNKKAKEMTLSECALLAGLVKSPNNYSPYVDPQKTKTRRDVVINKMLELGFITKTDAEAAKKTPVEVEPIKEKNIRAPYFVEYVKQLLIEEFGENVVFKGGLQVHTTIDLQKQAYAEEAIAKTLDREDDPDASLVAIEPKTGYIRVMVGGKDFNTQKFNLAVQGKRQAGSAFKTFVLATAIEEGIPPNKIYDSGPITIKLPGEDWRVTNYSGGGGPPMTVWQGTVKSVNGVYARLMMDVGPEKVVKVAKKMGITSPLEANPAIALGGLKIGVCSLEMASAYGTLANEGVHCEPIAILKILDSEGTLIKENKIQGKAAIAPGTAYLATCILQDVITRGTGIRAKIGRPAAGKTGTAQNYRDAWFAGYTPDLSTAVWVGYQKGQIPMRNVHGIRVTGGSFPTQIWARFMVKSLEDTPRTAFPIPKAGLVRVTICAETGLLPTEFCPKLTVGTFVRGTQPTKKCKLHQGIEVPNVIGLTETQAISALQELKFEMNKITEYSNTVPIGSVVAQNPEPASLAKEKAVVTITVSLGPSEDEPLEEEETPHEKTTNTP
ncbi:PBP1A family penicillin-binding protein [Candidatus Oleimmundimicrobium sp.]|uniref:penicillin-binding protein n=1 Tax=Candidatus Oleimmundimicrobium sp. TaxID=3060597 RepID=UPI0027202B7A|nr:PBP1A family penicillin-binding protein [Candidatus Oleimmundimicrobium sp.]MDO8886122.1 PBP1A family penicillin-binding protein [Candidatus Oleimmundimicrobium sp.]